MIKRIFKIFTLSTTLLISTTTWCEYEKPTTYKKIFENGLTVLVRQIKGVSRVAVQIWYGVGSKHESDQEKGFAHLLEHMIFKGTKLLTESDIGALAYKLGGYCNASTSYDRTEYHFTVPKANWAYVIPVLADCMRNCTLKDDMLNSEFKAVIQELRMNKDQYRRALHLELIRLCFPEHPYQYPVIGYQRDLRKASHATLKNFYDKYYMPNNAVLVIAGDVDAQEVFTCVEKHFGTIEKGSAIPESFIPIREECIARNSIIYRSVQKPIIGLAFAIPGLCVIDRTALEALNYIIGGSFHSRLYQTLVHEKKIATTISSSYLALFDHGIFLIFCNPVDQESVEACTQAIHQQLQMLVEYGPTTAETECAIKNIESSHYNFLESTESQASVLGQLYLATRDERALEFKKPTDYESFKNTVHTLLKKCYSPLKTHSALLLPLPEQEKERWSQAQKQYDEEDAHILSDHIRESAVEKPSTASEITPIISDEKNYPQPETITLKNGLSVLYFHNPTIEKINVQFDFKASHIKYEPQEFPGMFQILKYMITEGTTTHPDQSWIYQLESRGIQFSTRKGGLYFSTIKSDLSCALQLLYELCTQAELSEKAFEKAVLYARAQYANYLDNPHAQMSALASQLLYKKHPYGVMRILTPEILEKITVEDVKQFYKKIASPQESRLIIVGDLSGYDIPELANKIFGEWEGPKIETITLPEVQPIIKSEHAITIDRDQTVLQWIGFSVTRFDADFIPLMLFNIILSNGISGRLFKLREQTGAFYSSSGAGVSKAERTQPGHAFIKTMVSNNRLEEVKKLIEEFMQTIADSLTQEELESAQRAIIYDLQASYDTNHDIIKSFAYLDNFNLPFDYFATHIKDIQSVTLEQVQKAVKRVFDLEKMIFIKAGRV